MKRYSDKLETLKIKAALVSYFRFKKGHSIVCTEFNYGSADVLSISDNEQEIYEVEVKVSLSDLKREPSKGKHKRHPQHLAYSKPCMFFSLAVPEALEAQAKEICKQYFPYAGLFVVRDGNYSSYGTPGVITIIKAQPLIPHLSKDLREKIIRGMANNLAKLYYDLIEAKKKPIP